MSVLIITHLFFYCYSQCALQNAILFGMHIANISDALDLFAIYNK